MKTSSIAFTYPGEGSQLVGVLKELATNFPLVGDTFREASNALEIGRTIVSLAIFGPDTPN